MVGKIVEGHLRGKIINCCPKCGGRIIVSDIRLYYENYAVGKSGKVSSKRIGVDRGGNHSSSARCENDCGVYWDDGEFREYHEMFVDSKYFDNGRTLAAYRAWCEKLEE